jgi:hypothetical protein
MKALKHTTIAVFLLLVPLVVSAQGGNVFTPSGGNIAPPSGGNYVGFQNPLNAKNICDALKLFLEALLTLAIPVAVLFLVYPGFLFVWARGKPAGLVHARRNLFYTILGIAILMGAWLLGQLVANTFNALAVGAGQQNNQIGQCK